MKVRQRIRVAAACLGVPVVMAMASPALAAGPNDAASVTAAPTAPTQTAPTLGQEKVTVRWTPSSPNGGTAISQYTATAVRLDQVEAGTCSAHPWETSCTIDGLMPSWSYNLKVEATNASNAKSPASNIINVIIPQPATAPIDIAGYRTGNEAKITWKPPTANGGSTVTSYTVGLASPGADQLGCTTTDALTCTVNGLDDNSNYAITVKATTVAGPGAPGNASIGIQTVPSEPASVQAVASLEHTGQINVYWHRPTIDGKSTLTGYTLTATGSDQSIRTREITDPNVTDSAIVNLNSGVSYTVKVTAKNAIGSGPATQAPRSYTPR